MEKSAVKIEKVLIIDDDDNIRLIAQIALDGLTSWQVGQASSGGEALKFLASEKPDLILLDVMMPDMTGITLLEKAQELYGINMPIVIFMTAKVQVGEVEKYHALGAAGVIMKPFDPMKLPTQINDVISRLNA